jgi:hypothetical protein
MQDRARQIFVEMIRDCGEDIVRMQSSFEMYLNQYLVDYPEEKLLLLDAFKVGIPQKIYQHAGEKNYDRYLQKLGPRFAETARRTEDDCAWGVETWAIALNRTADYVAKTEADRIYPEDVAAVTQISPTKQAATNVAMAAIVCSGGFLGGLFAMLLVLAMLPGLLGMLLGGGSGANAEAGSQLARSAWYMVIAFAVANGVLATLPTAAAWYLGRGAENPWASFGVAMGAAFTSFFMCLFVPIIPLPAKVIAYVAMIFGATYKSAARGGNY